MSVVWRAYDSVLDRPVAVKVLSGTFATSAYARRRIRSEAQAAARLSHPNVTNVYDYGESVDDDRCVPYVVMELLPGRTLADRLAAGPLGPRAALRICAEVGRALAAAHARQLVHRDVKPANVMLTPSGAKVVDFGIAAVAGLPERDVDGQVLGTPAYLAPERLAGGDVLPASDVYALGLLIYQTLVNHLPWQVETTTQMLAAQVYVEPAPLPSLAGVPPEVHDAYLRCVAKDPADRPAAGEVAEILARAAGLVGPLEDGEPAPAPTAAVEPAPVPTAAVEPASAATAPVELAPGPIVADAPTVAVPRARRRRATVLAAGAAVVGVLAGVAALTSRDGESEAAGPVPAVRTSATEGAPSAAATAPPTVTTTPRAAGAVDIVPTPRATSGATAPTNPVPPPPAAGTPTPAGVPISALGGVVYVSCTGNLAEVVAIAEAAGYTIKEAIRGPIGEIKVILRSPTNESEIKSKCADGVPKPEVREHPR